MTPEEENKLKEICRRVIEEQDPKKFDDLVKQMNELLEKKYERVNKPNPALRTLLLMTKAKRHI